MLSLYAAGLDQLECFVVSVHAGAEHVVRELPAVLERVERPNDEVSPPITTLMSECVCIALIIVLKPDSVLISATVRSRQPS